MARPLRLEFPGAVYHVLARGHERGAIFRDDADRERWLGLLGRAAADQGWQVHAYCLMANHYRLLVETPRGRLSAGVRSLNGRYGQWFNRRRRRRGHVFHGRFKAVLVQKPSHLLGLCRYVVLDPVRARVAAGPGGWPWSNYRATVGRKRAPDWLNVDWTLSRFAEGRSAARLAYRRFVAEGRRAPSPLDGVRAQIYLGDEDFLAGMGRLASKRRSGSDISLRQRRPRLPTIPAVKDAVAREWGVPPEALSRNRGGEDKAAAIYLARRLTGLPGRQIAAAFGIKPARVSNAVRAIEEVARPALKRRLERLTAALRTARSTS